MGARWGIPAATWLERQAAENLQACGVGKEGLPTWYPEGADGLAAGAAR